MDHTSLQYLSTTDRSLFFQFGFGPVTPHPTFACVHHAFLHHASRYPDSVAVEHGTDVVTYSTLADASNYLARLLRAQGVRPGARVCILASRGISLVMAMLGVVRAGGQYVPLDGGIVTDLTLRFVTTNAEVALVLTLRAFAHRVPKDVPHLIIEDVMDDFSSAVPLDLSPVQDLSQSHHGLYVIYTSGTTGQPKGVSITHSNVTNLVQHSPGNLGLTHGSRVGQILNIAFDMAAWEMWGSLTNGATLVIRDEWVSTMKKIDTVIATPTILQAYPPNLYPNIRVAATAGEPCPVDLADAWAAHGTFYNSCGPTEITIVNTMISHTYGAVLSIGKPTPNNSVYILDESMRPIPIGTPGVLWAGGLGIFSGYVKLPELNAARLKHDPYRGEGFMFNTGDLGRWNEDGTIEILGRADDQIKIKGFRVELDGVKAAMETTPGIVTASALKVGSALVGFYSPALPTAEVKAATAKIMPYYAVPTQFYPLDRFPLTSNGKTDKRALRQIAEVPSSFALPKSLPPVVNETVEIEAIKLPSSTSTSTVNASHSSAYHKPGDSEETLDEKEAVKPALIEQGYAWEGYEHDEIPEKTQARWARNLRHQIFTLYRRMFGVVFIVNLAILIAKLAQGGLSTLSIGKIVTANLLCAILMRQDHVVNAFFTVFCAIPTSWPLAIRRVCARVYHIGGLHSGCSISATVWFIYFTVQITIDFTRQKTSMATLVFTYLIIVLLFAIIFFAYPQNRLVRHDTFEKTHRFLGWTATALVWIHTILLTNDFKGPAQSLGDALLHSAPFWMVVVLTMSIILPWTKLRKVPVHSEVLSNHAIRLYFEYDTPVAGSYTRISRSPLFEWHSFATVPVPNQKGYSLVVSRAGDWTSETIAEPPTHLWVRGVPTCGVLRIVPLFNRLVFVATGSGIGPCAPCIFNQKVPIRLLWTSPDVRKTFGDKFVDSILEKSPDAVIYDTRKHGKPDMVKLTYRLVKEFNAEAVCVISNQKLTRKIVYGMVSRGIPAFGAIWDS